MRIAIDLSCWANHRGYGRYTRQLLTALLDRGEPRHTYLGFADAATVARATFPPGIDVLPVRLSEAPVEAASADGRRKLVDIARMSAAVWRARPDVVYFPSNYSYFPVLGRARTIVTIHDAIAERLPHLIFPSRASRVAWTAKNRLACWQADRVVTVSADAARAIREHLPVPAERLRIVSEAADPIFRVLDAPADLAQRRATLERYQLPTDAPLVLYVGGFAPHKNVDGLVDAFAELHAQRSPSSGAPQPHLVLVGATTTEVFHSSYAALREQIERLGLAAHVSFTGYVPDADLVHLYGAAACLVLPSFDEGFGLPVVEALACGAPVIASRVGALPELLAGDAGILVDAAQPAELLAALRRVLELPALRAELRQRGLARAREFTWAQAATQLRAVFDEFDPGAAPYAARPAQGVHA